MLSLIVLLLIVILLDYSLSYRPSLIVNKRLYITTKLNSLRDLEATPAGESISPAVFEEDLYGILCVSQNATREELRDSYWKIAALNHPDRNSSEEATQIFRNASRAYQILGKNEKTRQLYDNQYKAKMYLNVVEEVGAEVLVPLARDVAMPLINMTVKSIGSFAIPFFRDAFEQSSAALQAAFTKDSKNNLDDDDDDDDGLNLFDAVTRASAALEKKSYQQKLRRSMEQIDSCEKQLNDAITELEKTNLKDGEIVEDLRKLEVDEISYISKASQAESALTIAVTNFNSANEKAMVAEKEYKKRSGTVIDLRNRQQAIDYELTSLVTEVKRLEEALAAAKAKVQNLQVEQISVAVDVDRESKLISRYEEDYKQASMFKQEREQELTEAQTKRDKYVDEATNAGNTRSDANATINRNKEFKAVLEKKVAQLTLKKSTLEKVRYDIINDWNNKKKILLEESVKKTDRESELEDKINAMEKKVNEMKKQIEKERLK